MAATKRATSVLQLLATSPPTKASTAAAKADAGLEGPVEGTPTPAKVVGPAAKRARGAAGKAKASKVVSDPAANKPSTSAPRPEAATAPGAPGPPAAPANPAASPSPSPTPPASALAADSPAGSSPPSATEDEAKAAPAASATPATSGPAEAVPAEGVAARGMAGGAAAPPQEKKVGGEAPKATPGRNQIDPLTGKKLQRQVNEKKTKEEERQKAAKLLEANAGLFAAPPEKSESRQEDAEEDDGEDLGDETWDAERRAKVAEAAWCCQDGAAATDPVTPLSSPAFDPAAAASAAAWRTAAGPGGGAPFAALLPLVEAVEGRVEAPALCAIANFFRQLLHHSAHREADMAAALAVLMAGNHKALQRQLPDAVAAAFSLPRSAARAASADELAEQALAGRSRQRALFQPRRARAADVAALLEGYGALEAGREQPAKNGKKQAQELEEKLVKLLSSSVKEGKETLHLVRVLQGRLGVTWDVVLRGLAHAFALPHLPAGAKGAEKEKEARERAEALVAMEDAVLRAYSQDGARVERLVAALVGGKTGEALVAACPPTVGVPVAPMRAEAAKGGVQGAFAKLAPGGEAEAEADKAPVLAEWLLRGDRAQVHVQDGGKTLTIFGSKLAPRADLVEEATAILGDSLKDVDSCVLDVLFPKPLKKAATTPAAAAAAEPSASSPSASASSPSASAPSASAFFGAAAAAGADGAVAAAAAEGQEEGSPKVKKPEPATKQDDKEKEPEMVKERSIIILDVLILNGKSLMQASLRERRAELQRIVSEHPRLRVSRGTEIAPGTSEERARAVAASLDEALGASYLAASREEKAFSRADGLVLKALDGPEAAYFAGCRFGSWQALERPPIRGAEADQRLLGEVLPEEERKFIPDLSEFHYTVISGFRTRSVEGINDILNIQKLYTNAGVSPTWYVDNVCDEEYRQLGLKVVKAGKLIPARNHALRDAVAINKICVQTSDDIGSWTFFTDPVKYPSDEEANAAWKRTEKLEVSPVAAARYLVAKMRSRGEGRCRLGGVYPLSNGGRAMRAQPQGWGHFILGDFFAAEVSPCRFDENMSLKEDYDFTCSHLEAFGEAFRCNRMVITAKHETNAGGACAIRDAAGERERYNINILKEKWPGAIKNHPSRANQVVLRWKSLKRKAPEQETAEESPNGKGAKQQKKQ